MHDWCLVAEIDIFEGKNEGLLLIETEFQDGLQAPSFLPPSWFGVDVTGNPAYKNTLLAK
jgi:CYTH domain-containing protein